MNETATSQTASFPAGATTHYDTARELLAASLQQAMPNPDRQYPSYTTYRFADPVFSRFLIRASPDPWKALESTTSLTSADFIFNGPSISTPLIEGKNASGGHTYLSIMEANEGQSLASLMSLGAKSCADLLAEHPEALEHLFRLAAFVGLHEKAGREDHADVDSTNVFRANDGSFSLIDQMSYEDVQWRFGNNLQDCIKADHSIANMRDLLKTIIRNGELAGCDRQKMAELRNAVKTYSDASFDILNTAYAMEDAKESWEYLKANLSDKNMEEWRGLEDGATDSPAFQKVHSVSATSIDIDAKGSAQQLLDLLNKLHGASVARAR